MIADRSQIPGLSVTNTPNQEFCIHSTFQLSAQITAAGGAVPPGNITFITWHNGTATTQGTGAINPGTGIATYTVPANTFTSGQIYYIQATYPGSGIYAPQSTPANTAGVRINPSNSLTTATVITSIGAFCVYSNENIPVTVTTTIAGAPNPTAGVVTIFGFFDGTPYSLGSASLSGSDSVNVPCNDGGLNWNWPEVGTFPIYATYAGDGSCYAGSTSPEITLTTFTNSVLLGVPLINGTGVHTFCSNSGQSDNWSVGVAAGSGSVTGTFKLYSTFNESVAIASTTTTVVGGSGTVTWSSVPESAFADANQRVYAVFTPTVTTNCYAGAQSSQSAAFNVVSSSSAGQTPTVQIGASNVSGFSFPGSTNITQTTGSGGNAPLYLRAQVNKGSGVGDDSGSVYYYIWDASFNIVTSGVFFTNVFFTDSGGSTTLTAQVTLPAGITQTNSPPLEPDTGYGTYYIQAQYTGNGCFAFNNSNVVTLQVNQLIA